MVLGGTAPLISTVIRSSDAVARECRAQGILASISSPDGSKASNRSGARSAEATPSAGPRQRPRPRRRLRPRTSPAPAQRARSSPRSRMTSRRFEPIGGILNRTATDPLQSTVQRTPPRRQPPTPRRPPSPSCPAGQAPAVPSGWQRNGRAAKCRPAPMGECVASRSGSTPSCILPSPRGRAASRTSQGPIVFDGIEAAHQAEVLTDLVAVEVAHRSPAAFPAAQNPRDGASNRPRRDPPRRPSRHRPRPARHPDRRQLPHPAHRRLPPSPPLTHPTRPILLGKLDVAGRRATGPASGRASPPRPENRLRRGRCVKGPGQRRLRRRRVAPRSLSPLPPLTHRSAGPRPGL